MAYQTILLDIADDVATVTLNRPDKLNAVDSLMVTELQQCLDKAEADDKVRVALLNCAGRTSPAAFDPSRRGGSAGDLFQGGRWRAGEVAGEDPV